MQPLIFLLSSYGLRLNHTPDHQPVSESKHANAVSEHRSFLSYYDRANGVRSQVFNEFEKMMSQSDSDISTSVILSFVFFCVCSAVYFLYHSRELEDGALNMIYVLTFAISIVSAKGAFMMAHLCPVGCSVVESLAISLAWVGSRHLDGRRQMWQEDVRSLVSTTWPHALCMAASLLLLNVGLYHMNLFCLATLLMFYPLSKALMTTVVKRTDLKASVVGCTLIAICGCLLVVLTGHETGIPASLCLLSMKLRAIEKYVRPKSCEHRFDVSAIVASAITIGVWLCVGQNQLIIPVRQNYLLLTLSAFATAISAGCLITFCKSNVREPVHAVACGMLLLCSRFVMGESMDILQLVGILLVVGANFCFQCNHNKALSGKNAPDLDAILAAKDQLL